MANSEMMSVNVTRTLRETETSIMNAIQFSELRYLTQKSKSKNRVG